MADYTSQPAGSGNPVRAADVPSIPDKPEASPGGTATSPSSMSSPPMSTRAPSSPASPSSKTTPSPAQKAGAPSAAKGITTKIFQFLSTATPERLGAVGAGLAATTYFVLGRVGLVLIGAFGGIVLFVAWEARNPDIARAVHGETGADTIARVIEYRKKTTAAKKGETEDGSANEALATFNLAAEEQSLNRAFEEFRPETRQALDNLVQAVIRDYVKWWYDPIVPSDQSFALTSRRTFTTFLLSVSNHLSRKRPADAFLDFLTNSSSIVIVLFSELSNAFAEHSQSQMQQQQPPLSESDLTAAAADAVYNYLASNTDSNLANLLNQRQQAAKFRMVADDLLNFLDRDTYNCSPAHVFLREILANCVLETTLQTCSKPEWINGWIVYLLEAGEPDFSQALDAGMQTRTDTSGSSNNNAFVDIDGNVGNISLSKGHRSSFDTEKSRRKESLVHKKQLSRADEEMEEAMEEMKRMNQMIADEEARRVEEAARREKEAKATAEAEQRLAGAMQRNVDALEIQPAGAILSPTDTETAKSIVAQTAEAKEASEADEATKSIDGNKRNGYANLPSPGASEKTSSDEHSRGAVTGHTPLTPRSSDGDSPSQPSFAASESKSIAETGTTADTTLATSSQFTSFDQLVPPAREDEDSDADSLRPAARPPLTLHNASITIHDEPVSDKGRLKSKPAWDFLIQIEPATSHYPGWMIVRKFADFERLHEVLRRIATISGATAFTEQHGVLPNWKLHTRTSFRGELERYVRDACWYQSLAESEGMKRFLEKDTNNMPASKTGLQAFESMGKNVLGALSTANKGVAESRKVVVEGVTGVLGNLTLGGAQKKHSLTSSTSAATVNGTATSGTAGNNGNASSNNLPSSPSDSVLQDVTGYTKRLSVSTPPRVDSGILSNMTGATARRSRDSMDSQQSSVVSSQPGKVPHMDRRPSYQAQSSGVDGDVDPLHAIRGRLGLLDNASASNQNSRQNSRASSVAGRLRSPSSVSLSGTRLPPPLSGDLADHFTASPASSPVRSSANSLAGGNKDKIISSSSDQSTQIPPQTKKVAMSGTRQFSGISEGETRVAVELLFAVINELYTLSSAWNIRRTLLAAAKSFLLRPGNPSLVSIQNMMQSSVLEANTSDAGLASLLCKLRENSLPTEEELAAWPAEMTAEEKEKLRIKARRLMIQSGVPAALMGVMGQTATADAMGRLFDCLQIEEVARGLIFGLMLQAARIVTH